MSGCGNVTPSAILAEVRVPLLRRLPYGRPPAAPLQSTALPASRKGYGPS
jgi:hypothetical protein